MFLNNRYQDPQLGHFISVDPLVSKTGTPYLYGNGNPSTLSDPSGLIGTATICTGVDGIGCVNKTTAKGFTSYQLTPNGDVVSAVAHWQGWKPFDYTEEWVKANGNTTEKRINYELHDCQGGDSDGECGRLAILLSGGSIDQANHQWAQVCDARPGLCDNAGSAVGMRFWEEVAFNATVFMTAWNLAGMVRGGVAGLLADSAEVTYASSGIDISEAGLAHVFDRHVAGGALNTATKSTFFDNVSVTRLIADADVVTPVMQVNGNFKYVVDAGRNIGIDRATGQATSIYSVITNAVGELKAAFPGV